MLQIPWREISQTFGQSNGRIAAHTQRGAVSDAVELFADRSVDSWMVVAMDVAPHTARTIEIRTALDINQSTALCPLNNQGLVLRHLSEGVPMMAQVPILQLVSGRILAH